MGLGDFYGCYMGNSKHFIIAPSQWVWLLCNPVRACVRNRRVFVVPAEAGTQGHYWIPACAGMTGNLVGPASDTSHSRKIVTHALSSTLKFGEAAIAVSLMFLADLR